ncbi:MAG: hypothetical protein PHS30_00075 [Bacteroidales bacterium]|nr:hypothetical protein [Bacteroidales bacterium]
MTDLKKIGHTLIAAILVLFLSGCQKAKTIPEKISSDQQEMFHLLKDWCDAMLHDQLESENPGIDGGIICPGCCRIHGRCADAIYPFLYMAEQTGDPKYTAAAKRLFTWGEKNMRFADGSWNNDVNIMKWQGITVFGLTVLAESLRDFSPLLDDSTKNAWTIRMKEEADFVLSFIKVGVGNINYSMCACYPLALVGQLTGDKKYSDRAEELNKEVSEFYTENEFLLYGEGSYPYVKSKKGTLPIDLGYNVEQTLPYMAAYAKLTGKKEMLENVRRSMLSHIEFMLGDGAWDNSWGTRNFKWSYWGSRTSDGVLPLCSIYSSDSLIAEAGYRNFELLRQSTHDGLLYGGRDYISAGYEACIHHTVNHSRALAVALKQGFKKPQKRILLPRETGYGAKLIRDIDTWLVSVGDWNATITGYDSEYHILGGHVMGGALSLLWNKKTGPLLAAGMSEYSMVEGMNMQMPKGSVNTPAAFRVEFMENGVMFSNIYDKEASIKNEKVGDTETFIVHTRLLNANANPPKAGSIPVQIQYFFAGQGVKISVISGQTFQADGLRLVVPIISAAKEKLTSSSNTAYAIQKEQAVVKVTSNSKINILDTEANGRIIDMAPGFEAIPFSVDLPKNKEILFGIEVNRE